MAAAILCMAGAAFVGVMNKQTRDNEIVLRNEAERDYEITLNELNQEKTNLAEAKKAHGEAQDTRDKASADLALLEQELKRQEATIAKAKVRLEQIAVEQKEIDLVVAKLDGITSVDELIAKEKGLNDTLIEKTAAKDAEVVKLAASTKMKITIETSVRGLEKKQLERSKVIALNGLEAMVVAVNKDWGFVMVNAGMTLGVSASSSMLVKRGEELIARLRIVTLAPDMVVCDIVPESISKGTRVMPGDKVVFENTL